MDRSEKQPSAPQGMYRIHRARSLPSAGPFRVAVFFFAMHWLGLVVAVTALVCYVKEPGNAASRILLGGLGFSAVAWIVAFFKRRSTHCPLCKGTPLMNSGARTHVRAKRIFPFSHGLTAILTILATQKFRCMYCGSDFDLLKPPTRLLRGDAPPSDEPPAPHDNRA